VPPVLRTLLAALALVQFAAAQSPDPPDIIWQDEALSSYYNLGYSTAWLGDLNGDEIDDYAVGAPGLRAVKVYDGDSKSEITQLNGNVRHGHSLTSVGDVTGDGIRDFAAGTPFINSNRGEVRVYSGADFSIVYTISGSANGDYLGWGLASVGDTDGDGVPDLLVRSYKNQGAVSVHSGVDGSFRYEITTPAGFEYAGKGLAGVHDYNSDGAADFLVGIPGRGTGEVVLHSGTDGAVLSRLQSPTSREFGSSICQLGDVNGDLVPDFAVGAPATTRLAQSHVGEVRLFSGLTLNQIGWKQGSAQSDSFGDLVASGGDYNRDGVADVLVAVPGADVGGLSNVGRVELLSGVDLTLLGSAMGTEQFERMPTSLAGYGDAHHDASPDFLIGNSAFGGSENGIVRMFGAPSPWLQASELIAGQSATLTASNCEGGSAVTFWASLAGSGPTPTPLGLALLSPPFRELGTAIVAPSGIAELSDGVPAGLAGTRVYFQASESRLGGSTRLSTATTLVVQ